MTQEEVALLAATRLISNFDENEDGELTADEVPAPLWDRFESADADVIYHSPCVSDGGD